MKVGVASRVLPAFALAALCSQMAAQTPPGSAILDRYIEVTGGRAAYENLHTEIRTATMELAGKGMKFSVTIYRAAPDKSYSIVEMPGLGNAEEGTNGTVVWSRSAMQGPRIKEGDEREMTLLAAAFNADLLWREFYSSAENNGLEDVEGEPCYKVDLTSKNGNKQTRYYSKKTGLMTKSAMTLKTQMGDIPTESLVSDYRSEGGILMPHKTVTKMAAQELIMTVESVKPNAPIEPSRFDLPDEIKALAGKNK
jgi:hypothetical protein